jgi:hypothetical protein
VIYRSRYVADLQGTKLFANRNVPNCSIAFATKRTPVGQPSEETFFLLRDPNYKLFRELLSARKRGACRAPQGLFRKWENGDSHAILLRKTNLMEWAELYLHEIRSPCEQ